MERGLLQTSLYQRYETVCDVTWDRDSCVGTGIILLLVIVKIHFTHQ